MIVETYQLENYNCGQIAGWVLLQSFNSYFIKCESVDESNVSLHFTQTLAGVDKQALDSYMESYEPDSYNAEVRSTDDKSYDGAATYNRIISLVNIEGGLPGTTDSNIIPAIKMLSTVRGMLKDGFFETSLRLYWLEIKPLGLLTEDQESQALGLIEEMAIKHTKDLAQTQDFISNYRTAAEGEM